MKNFKIIFLLVAIIGGLMLMQGCNNEANADQLLQNEPTRQQVFEKITANHEMMTDFMDVMMKNEHAMMMMKGNGGMMDMMMGEGNMMKMMREKPEMMHQMMSEMIKDGKMVEHMMQMMNQEGMMSEECMQSCMKMMSDKGMNGSGTMGETGMMKNGKHN